MALDRVWCCDWGLLRNEKSDTKSLPVGQSPRHRTRAMCSPLKRQGKDFVEFVVTGGHKPELQLVHIMSDEKNCFPYVSTLQLPLGRGVHKVVVSPDCSTIAAVSMCGKLMLIDVQHGVRLPSVGHRLVNDFWCTAYSRGCNEVIYAGSGNGMIFTYDTEEGKLCHTYDPHRMDIIMDMAISDNRQLLGCCDYAGGVTLLDGATGQILHSKEYMNPMRKLVFDANNRRALAACNAGIKIIDLNSGLLSGVLMGYEAPVISVAISPDNQRFVSGASDGIVKVWDMRSTKEILAVKCPTNKSLTDVAFNRRSNKFCFVGEGKGLNIYYYLGTKEFMLV